MCSSKAFAFVSEDGTPLTYLGLEDLEEVLINDILLYFGFLFIVLHETCKQTNKQA